MALDKMITVKQLAEIGPWTESAIRWMIFKNTDGFEQRCVRRIGRRVLIDLDEVERLVDEQNPQMRLPFA